MSEINIPSDDWRRQGQEKYLKGVKIVFKEYHPYRTGWEHDHCEFCGSKFSLNEGDLKNGYSTEDGYRWICNDCFKDFKDEFKWKVEDMKNINFDDSRMFINSIIEILRKTLDEESVNDVQHYLNHDEYEMAFEGLFIEIMKLNIVPKIDFFKSREVGKFLKLDKESVFDPNFWGKFDKYITSSEASSHEENEGSIS